MSEPRVYICEREINGVRYGEELVARDLVEAERRAALIGSTVIGMAEESSCSGCGKVFRRGEPELSPNEWPEEGITVKP